MKNKQSKVFAIITAGGIGSRMNLEVPKQFYEVDGKPIVFYTLNKKKKSKDIDEICLVYLKGYKKYFEDLIKKERLTKVKILVEGGETNQLSIFNGLVGINGVAKDDDIIMIHDGIRPLVDNDVIETNLEVCKEKGNAVTVVSSNEAMLYSENKLYSSQSLNRDFIMRTQTPHSMRYKEMMELVERTISKGITNSVAICTMLIEDNQKVYFSKGSNINFKVTYPEDIDIFRALLKVRKSK